MYLTSGCSSPGKLHVEVALFHNITSFNAKGSLYWHHMWAYNSSSTETASFTCTNACLSCRAIFQPHSMRSLDAMSFKILALETYMYKTLLAGALLRTL